MGRFQLWKSVYFVGHSGDATQSRWWKGFDAIYTLYNLKVWYIGLTCLTMYVVLNRLRQYKEGVKNISHIHAVWKIIHPFLCQPIRDSIISLSHLTCMALFFIPFWFHHNLVYLFVFCFLKIGRWWLLGNCGDKRRQRWGLSSCRWFNRSITRYD